MFEKIQKMGNHFKKLFWYVKNVAKRKNNSNYKEGMIDSQCVGISSPIRFFVRKKMQKVGNSKILFTLGNVFYFDKKTQAVYWF